MLSKYRNKLLFLTLLGVFTTSMQAEDNLSRNLSEANKEGRIWTSFALNPHLDAFDLSVDVKDKMAVLEGTVDSAIERELAEQVALSVAGITSVDNNIKVDANYQRPTRAPDYRSQSALARDANIVAGVRNKLVWNNQTNGLDIKVMSADRKVTLSGTVDSAKSKEIAGRLASNTAYVVAVDNQLMVKSDVKRIASAEPVTDAWVSAKVKSSLLYSRFVDGLNIEVTTKEGVVTLSGQVDSTAERTLAVELAENVRGVKRVEAGGLKARG